MFKVVDNVAVLQKVKTGRRNDQFVEIIDGLTTTEKVIIHPGNSVVDGVRIESR